MKREHDYGENDDRGLSKFLQEWRAVSRIVRIVRTDTHYYWPSCTFDELFQLKALLKRDSWLQVIIKPLLQHWHDLLKTMCNYLCVQSLRF